jgi:hypothetical protein
MKMLVIGFIFWIFIVPSLAGSFLILAFLAAFVLPLYFALTWFVIAFTTALVLCGPFWIVPFTRSGFRYSPSSRHETNSSQEKNNEAHHRDKVFFQ